MLWGAFVSSVLCFCFLGNHAGVASPLPSSEALIQQLQNAYPQYINTTERDGDGYLWVTMASGDRLLFDDRREKSPEEALNAPDLQDMLAQPYSCGPVLVAPQPQEHPGRVRVEAFFKSVYGANRASVEQNLVPVSFLGKRVLFNGQNNAAEALRHVGQELSSLLAQHPSYKAFVLPVSGTMCWRTVSGTDRLSAHSFGIAIDLAAKRNTYWRYQGGPGPLLEERQRFPAEIVEIFEKNGFVWGGKWWEYDLMHFEYRPELACPQRAKPTLLELGF